jgi:hypothetical protein
MNIDFIMPKFDILMLGDQYFVHVPYVKGTYSYFILSKISLKIFYHYRLLRLPLLRLILHLHHLHRHLLVLTYNCS